MNRRPRSLSGYCVGSCSERRGGVAPRWRWTPFLFLFGISPCLAAFPDTGVPFVGQVSDTKAMLVEGVILYLTPAESDCSEAASGHAGSAGRWAISTRPAAVEASTVRMSPPTCPEIIVLTSDANGGFGGLAPQGRYRIAAVKPGYELLLSEIGVFAGGFLELRLRPSGPASRGRELRKGDDPNLDWILRNRSPDPLRDLRPVVSEQDKDMGARPDGAFANLLRSLDGEMAWSMSGLDPFGESPAAGETAGRSIGSTRTAVAPSSTATARASRRAALRPGRRWTIVRAPKLAASSAAAGSAVTSTVPAIPAASRVAA